MILIGTNHFDIDGPKRLAYFLEKYKPGKLALEVPGGLKVDDIERISRDRKASNRQRILDAGIPNLLKSLYCDISDSYGFEIMVPIKYAKKTGAEVYFVDHPNRTVMLEEDFLEQIQKAYGDADPPDVPYDVFREFYIGLWDDVYRGKGELLDQIDRELSEEDLNKLEEALPTSEEEQEEREQYMADEIIKVNPDMFPGGLDHVFGGYGFVNVVPLYQRLGDMVKYRFKLNRAFQTG